MSPSSTAYVHESCARPGDEAALDAARAGGRADHPPGCARCLRYVDGFDPTDEGLSAATSAWMSYQAVTGRETGAFRRFAEDIARDAFSPGSGLFDEVRSASAVSVDDERGFYLRLQRSLSGESGIGSLSQSGVAYAHDTGESLVRLRAWFQGELAEHPDLMAGLIGERIVPDADTVDAVQRLIRNRGGIELLCYRDGDVEVGIADHEQGGTISRVPAGLVLSASSPAELADRIHERLRSEYPGPDGEPGLAGLLDDLRQEYEYGLPFRVRDRDRELAVAGERGLDG